MARQSPRSQTVDLSRLLGAEACSIFEDLRAVRSRKLWKKDPVVIVPSQTQCDEVNRAKNRLVTSEGHSSRSTALTSPSKLAGGRPPGATVNAITDQGMLAEMASLLQTIERYWTTHFSAGHEIDPLTVLRVRSVLTEHRQRYRKAQYTVTK
jgi:hypothetical protein